MYWVTRYSEVRECLTSADFSVRFPFRITRQVFGETVLDMDGPRHRAHRSILAVLLGPRPGAPSFQQVAAAAAGRAVVGLAGRRTVDFAQEVADVLPLVISTTFVGVPAAERARVGRQVSALLDHLDGTERDFASASRLREELHARLGELLRAGDAGGVTRPLAALVAAGRLPPGEAASMLLLLLAAGVRATAGMLANTLVCLLAPGDWRERLVRQPGLLRPFLREVLRLEPPQHDTVRFTTAARMMAGTELPAGAAVKVVLASANRDAAVFPAADVFDPHRDQSATLVFGRGAHACAGSSPALSLAAAFFGQLLATHPGLRLVGAPRYATGTFRRPIVLPIVL